MEAHSDDPSILLLHDGELADVAALLAELGVRPIERRGTPTLEDLQASWGLVLGSPRRLLESGVLKSRGIHIAVMDTDSRTLRAQLKRSAIDFAVRRPVHPVALRLLILHALYQGPEKRRTQRVSVGARVRFRAGLRRRDALLADLSISGCRILASPGLARGRRIRVRLGSELTGGRAIGIKGRVKRSAPAGGEPAGTDAIAVAFDRISRRRAKQLAHVVERFAGGPAVLDEARAETPAGAPSDARPDFEGADRRGSPRREMPRRVISLDDQAARVLMGRDISLGGMRVEPHPGLSLGAQLQLALHVRAREAPLVVRARVERDDGEAGLLLEFFDLDDPSRQYLEKMVKFLPILATREADRDRGVIMSEILETSAA